MKNIIIVAVIIGLGALLVFGAKIVKGSNFANERISFVNGQENMSDLDTPLRKPSTTYSGTSDMTVSSLLNTTNLPANPNLEVMFDKDSLEDIYLAGGCFWGLEAYMSRVYGVYNVTSGYANGKTEEPAYEDLIYNNSGHAETVHIQYDPKLVSIETLLSYYLKVVDPTSLNKQGNDRGTQYRTGIYYTEDTKIENIEKTLNFEQEMYEDDIVIEVEPLVHYYLAEEYHQDYLEKNPNGYCHIDLDVVTEDISEYTKPSDDVIKEMLTDLQYKVTQKGGTEKAFSNEYWDNTEKGIYVDIVTGEPLFASKDKYKSGTGWPSFTQPISETVIVEVLDKRLGVDRVEVKSKLGDSHLGHVFDDGPKDRGGLRYCLNSASLKFISVDEMDDMGYGHLKYLVE